MEFLLLIYGDEEREANMSEADWAGQMKAYMAYTESLRVAGVMRGGNPLVPTREAKSVRKRDQATTVDGPFAETKEQLGGYYLIECADIDEACGYAADLPGAATGTIEVRAILAH